MKNETTSRNRAQRVEKIISIFVKYGIIEPANDTERLIAEKEREKNPLRYEQKRAEIIAIGKEYGII